ncbi:MAG TPA: hypothetical protein VFY87_14890 [Geminicoccaceae bacterium]|nr:hypothetical protein [Geminicoccaceae bacterium]
MTDAYGRVQARLGLNEAGVIDAALLEALPEASFSRRAGPWLFPALLLAVAALSLLVERRGV